MELIGLAEIATVLGVLAALGLAAAMLWAAWRPADRAAAARWLAEGRARWFAGPAQEMAGLRALGWAVAAAVTALLFLPALFAAAGFIWRAGDLAEPGFGLGALLVAILSAPFVIWRALNATRQARTAEQGLITDRINAALKGLASPVEHGISRRLGAILALERVARDSARDRDHVLEILNAYIQERNAALSSDEVADAAPPPDIAAATRVVVQIGG